ncbi:MAG: phosphoribosylanthranilate isomerase [Candidatus Aminicenantia bacterium]
MTKIKVCGITNLEDAKLAIELGVDAIGFIFSESPRKISIEKASEIVTSLNPFVIKVGVFCNEPIEYVREVERILNLDVLQFHGNETFEYVNSFRGKGVKVFKVKDESILKEIENYGCNFFFLDSQNKGKKFDWSIAIKAKRFGKFFLGGGLNPENIENALLTVSPFGVDVCSGVEIFPGKKDPLKLKDFLWRAKRWRIF